QAQRKADEAARKALLAKAGRGGAVVAEAGSSAAPATAASVETSRLVAGSMRRDDGLQPGERSLKSELAAEAEAKKAPDVQLQEAANILADEINAIRTRPKLAAQVLPHVVQAVD